MKKGNKAVESLVEILSKIPDPRDNRGKKHSLVKILFLAIVGFLIGKNDFANMVHCLKKQENKLKKYIDLENGIPSHDTFSRIMRIIDNMQMIYAICDWFGSLIDTNGKQLIIDGKGILAAAEKNKDKRTPYIVNVIEEASKMVLMQLKIDNKENEMTGILKVLDYIDIEDTVITIDAIGTQRPIIKKIKKKKGHFVLPVKENNEKLLGEIKLYVDEMIHSNKIKKHVEPYKDHGRNEKRTCYCIKENGCIDEKDYLHTVVKSVGKIVRERTEIMYEKDGKEKESKKSIQEVYYISDIEMSAEQMATYIRNHWEIENGLHWVLDNTFKEDRSTQKKESSIENTALIRKVAYNILRLQKNRVKSHSMEYIIDEFKYDLSMIMKYLTEPVSIMDN